MTRIPEPERDIIEKAIYLPMVLTILNIDFQLIEKGPFKIKEPYMHLISETIRIVQRELSAVNKYLKNNKIKVQKIKSDDAFTTYLFLYKGYEEHHNYFNPRLRNGVEKLLKHYLYERLHS